MFEDRIQSEELRAKIVSADEAANLVKDGMVVGMSGFTRAGDAKLVPHAMAKRAKKHPFKISLLTGASLGHDTDKILSETGVLARRMPFQVDTALRAAINRGEVMFIDEHLSEMVEQLRAHQLPPVNIAIIEAMMIHEDGSIVPTTSVGNSASFALGADKIIIELNTSLNPDFEGIHDIYIPSPRPNRKPVGVLKPDTRIGTTAIKVDKNKIAAIVISDVPDSPSLISPADDATNAIARHLTEFFLKEVDQGRMDMTLSPIQAGIGTIANAVLTGFVNSPFHNLQMYSEVLQDSTFELFDAGKLDFASASSITLSEACAARVFPNIGRYKDRLILRPQEISNLPEIIRRLGIIAINTALEFDIYGNVNSTHVGGTHMMNGIGGSGDFARNAYISVFVTKSVAKGGKISSVVPMVAHVDHTEHDVDVLVTELGYADLRGLAPRERAPLIIEKCAHPDYRDVLRDYFDRACKTAGGQTPHILEEAFSFHEKFKRTGSMLG
ncbi:acetyl-CoA hydrolase/transferase family protein [Bartonella sp. W8098]|uniref:acetyl-CoA hydrolase/transferase family protein n=1 Tax=Bartonella TaxID=773 RepID=UPI0018DB36D9|nr:MULTISPECIES: acetyl-CoA hydrolase/transferase family protein [Bartonella]MBH9987604.1 acetyl-CoA hydrolase/transferase family protein [Bartonella apis]MBI0171388.1 acetyl-CoA hydrolase/transferase family protein [Bartonella sp. W8151]